MSQPNRPDLEPLQTNDTATFLVGTALWAIALIILLIVQPGPSQHWWIWTCVVGVAGGLFGLVYVRRSRRARGGDAAAEPSASREREREPERERERRERERRERGRATPQAEEPAPPRRTGGAP